ncbi:MAG TPA: hypothetical protein VGI39_43835 [Polyangiaceae bacterium]|jgi:hypothetical protein
MRTLILLSAAFVVAACSSASENPNGESSSLSIQPEAVSSLSWVHESGTGIGVPPSNALVAGGEGTVFDYVCRASQSGLWYVGRYNRTLTGCLNEAGTFASFDILVYSAAGAIDTPAWVSATTAPSNAFVAVDSGLNSGGQHLLEYVCRANTATGDLLPGDLLSNGTTCAVRDKNQAYQNYTTFEVLTLASVTGGSSSGGSGSSSGGSASGGGGGTGGGQTCTASSCNAQCRACGARSGVCSSGGACTCTTNCI